MPASTRELPHINLRLHGVNAVMGDIPVELPVSPSSVDVDHEQLTVRPRLATFCPPADPSPPKSEPFIILMRENRSPYVRPCYLRLRQRSAHLPFVLVRSR